jgi:SPP1 gp7 family putative phage head morphogenesis protein
MNYQTEARDVLTLFLDRLLKREKKEFALLSFQWGEISKELEGLIEKIAEKEIKSEDQLYRLALYQQFLEESKDKVTEYSNIAAGIIADNQKAFGKAGLQSTQEMIGLKVKFFQKLPTEVINNFIGKSFYEGSKLNETLFASSYPDAMERVKQTLLNSIALGKNPRATARAIRKDDLSIPLWKSLRLARTEQMQIFRETSLLQMKKSGVVSGWERSERNDACEKCKELDGKVFKLDEPFETHPNCRGAMLPVID